VFVPEYNLAVNDPTVGYMTGADACYGDCISIASEVNKISKDNHLNLIVEDTGKRLQQTLNFIKDIGGTCDSRGRRRAVTVALVDNDPETAISRARGRFQREGRFSAPEYVRDSFRGVFDHYCQLKKMAAAGDIAVDSFIYCDNSQRGESKVDATTQLAPSMLTHHCRRLSRVSPRSPFTSFPPPHTVLVLCSYSTHTVLTLYSHCTHTVLICTGVAGAAQGRSATDRV
jgi:hypothetical protein